MGDSDLCSICGYELTICSGCCGLKICWHGWSTWGMGLCCILGLGLMVGLWRWVHWWFDGGFASIEVVGLMLGLSMVMGLRVDSLMVGLWALRQWVWCRHWLQWWVWGWVRWWFGFVCWWQLMGLGGGVWLTWVYFDFWVVTHGWLGRRCGLLVAGLLWVLDSRELVVVDVL